MIHALLLAVLPVSLAAPQEVNVATTDHAVLDSVLEVYDLRPLMPRFDFEPSWSRSLVFSPGDVHHEIDSTPLSGFYDQGSPEVIVDLLSRVLGDELRYEGREIRMDGETRLLVLAPAAVQKRVAATLAALQAVLTSSAQIIVDVLEIEGAPGDVWPSRNVVPGDEVERSIASALGRGGTHRRFHVGLTAGRTAILDQMRRFPIIHDYDVEIAQGAFINDPIVVEIEEGVRMFLRGVPQPGGLALSVVFQAAESLSLKNSPIESQGAVSREDSGGLSFIAGPKVVQSVELLNRSAAFDSFLPDGQAIVLASQSDLVGKQITQVVYLRSTGGELTQQRVQRLPDSTQTVVIVNSESLSLPTMGVDLDLTPAGYGFGLEHPAMQAVLSADPSLFLFDWMKFRFSVWHRLGPWAIVVTDPAWDNDAGSALEDLLASWKPVSGTVGLDVMLHAQGGNSRIPVRWSLPVRPGSACGLMLGVTSSALYDYDVEVAQFSSVADPVRVPVFDGLCLGVIPSALGDGGYSLDVRGSAQLLVGGPRSSFDPQGLMVGPVDQPTRDTLFVDEDHTVSAGASMVVGGETKEGERPVLRLELGVR